MACTGSKAHLRTLTKKTGSLRTLRSGHYLTEVALYRQHGFQYIEPELREVHDEVEKAKASNLPLLVTTADIRGDLHAHSTSSDGADSNEDMAEAARARGVSSTTYRNKSCFIDKLNGRLRGIRILKSSEVDILVRSITPTPC